MQKNISSKGKHGRRKMQKKYLPKIVNLTFILLLSLTFSLLAIFYQKEQDILADISIDSYQTTLSGPESFQAKLVNATIDGITDGKYSYNAASRVYNENLAGTPIESGDVIMLHNYEKTTGDSAQNVYLSFGKKYTENDGSYPVLTDIQNIYIFVNGQLQSTQIPTTNTTTSGELIINGLRSNYWYAYFDLNSDTFGNYGQGVYSIGFTYNLCVFNTATQSYEISNNLTYRFDFTLIDETIYAMPYTNHQNFPDVMQATNYVANGSFYKDTELLTYYYNYSVAQAPVLEYDAENYNITYTHSTNTTFDTYTTYVERNASNQLILHTLRNDVEVSAISLSQTDGHYLHHITFDTQGTYEITITYQLKNSLNSYQILDDVEVENYQFDKTHPDNTILSNKIQINVFGAKAYFNNNGVSQQLFYQDTNYTLNADFTANIYSHQTTPATSYQAIAGTQLGMKTYTESLGYFPVTNKGPITFSYYGTLSYNGSVPESSYVKYNTYSDMCEGKNATLVPLAKETSISEIGFYEVTLIYTSSNASNVATKFYQKFIFAIVSGEPTVNIYVGEDNTSPIGSKKYINQSVHVTTEPATIFSDTNVNLVNQQQFCYPFTTTYRMMTFQSSGYGQRNELTNTMSLTENGHYQIEVGYGISSQKVYEFTIDTQSPNEPTPTLVQPLYQSIDNPTIIGYVADPDYTITNLTNDWFAMQYDFTKPSGARVNVTYEKYIFTKDGSLAITNQDGYIPSGYILKDQTVEKNAYQFSQSVSGTISVTSVLKPTEPAFYVFTLTDEAGNSTKYSILFDNSAPNLIVQPEPTNQYHIINTDTTITWGVYKTLAIEQSILEKLEDSILSLGITMHNNTLPIAITRAEFQYIQNNAEVTQTYFPSNIQSVQLLAENGTTNVANGIFVGENFYSITVYDQSMISSLDTSSTYSLEMNLDQSLGMVFTGTTANPMNRVENLYTENLSNADGLYFSYIAGQSTTQFYLNEEDVTYTFYPFDTTAYAGTDNKTALSAMLQLIEEIQALQDSEGLTQDTIDRITPSYPFVSTPRIENQVVTRSTYVDSSDPERIFSICINPSPEDQNRTQEGMYIFRREYKNGFDASSTTDVKIRYYVMIIDRSHIIDIDASTVDYSQDNPYDLAFYFNNGGGISFDIGSNTSLYHMDALAIQNFINNPMAGTILFRTNKLPVTLSIPTEKYNTYQAFQQWIATLSADNALTQSEQEYLQKWYDNQKFNFDITDSTLQINVSNPDGGYVTKDLPLQLSNNEYNYTYQCLQSGQYTLTLQDPAGNTQKIVFEIVYDSPTGILKGKNNATLPSNNTYTYKSSNTEELYFQFETYDEDLVANIDVTNLVVRQITEQGTNTYIIEYHQDEQYSNIYANTKNSTPILTADKTVITTTPISGGTQYTITLLPSTYDSTTIPFDPMVEATYEITVEYENFASLGLPTEDWRKTFSITIDRTAPSVNFENLLAKDKYYGADALLQDPTLLDKYFLAVDKDHVIQYFGGLENSTLYYRTIKKIVQADGTIDATYPDYAPTNFFSPNAQDDEGNDLFTQVLTFTKDLTIESIFGSTTYPNYGYYELIEVDEAGNYTIYPVYYYSNDVTSYNTLPTIQFIYKEAGSSTTDSYLSGTITQDGMLLDNEDSTVGLDAMTLAKKGLQLGSITTTTDPENPEETIESIDYASGVMSVDAWLKVMISYQNQTVTLLNDPSTLAQANSWENFVNQFNTTLDTLETSYASYSFTITFVNRIGEDYVLQYLTPTEELRLKFVTINAHEFSMEIPKDSHTGGQTKLVSLAVYRFANNQYTPILRDSDNNQIILKEGNIYYFRDGQYKFEYTDNFQRTNTEYRAIGVEYFNEITYWNPQTGSVVPTQTKTITQVDDGVEKTIEMTYLSYSALLEFNSMVYQYEIQVYDQETQKYVNYLHSTYYQNGLFSVNIYDSNIDSTHRLIEVHFMQNDEIAYLDFNITLTHLGSEQTIIPYYFEITHEVPALKLLNFSGVTIQNVSTIASEPTQFSEDLYISWEESPFGQEVTLTKDNGTPILITDQNYLISEEGYYKLSISNGLGYDSDILGTTLYFRRTSSNIVMYEVMAISSDGYTETILNASPLRTTYTDPENAQQKYPVYEYYKLENTTTDIRLNKNKNLEYKIVEALDNSVLYCIYGSSSDYGYIRYIRVHTVKQSNTLISDATDPNRNSLVITDNDLKNSLGNPLVLNYQNKIQCTSKNGLTVSWSYYHYNDANPADRGNIIMASYYFNHEYVDTIYQTNQNNELVLSDAGYYQIYFRDLAGNTQQFLINGVTYNYLYFYIINDVLFTVNNAEPIPYQIFNGDVTIKLTNRDLYEAQVEITVQKDGKNYPLSSTGTSNNYTYTFTEHGSYEVTMISYIRDINVSSTEIKKIETKYVFTIINQNQVLLGYHVSPSYNFTVTNLVKDNVNITNLVEDKNSLWLSKMSYGNGKYTVTLSYYHESLKQTITFSFDIWINSEIPTLVASIDWGTSSSDTIIISFNMNIIYQQIGDSYLSISGMDPIIINSQTASTNQRTDIAINQIGDNWISLYTADGQLINSYKVTRTEPLNTLSIVLIVVGVIVGVVLIILFIVLRRRIRVR